MMINKPLTKKVAQKSTHKNVRANSKGYRAQYVQMLKLSFRFCEAHEHVLKRLGAQFFHKLADHKQERMFQMSAVLEIAKKPGNGISQKVRHLLKSPWTIWEHFCRGWLIDPYTWGGSIKTLSAKHIYPEPYLDWDHGVIRLYINRFVTLQDIQKLWPDIEKKQRYILTRPQELKNFRRNMEWYKKIKVEGKSYRELFRWVQTRRKKDLEEIVFHNFRKKTSWNIDVYDDREMLDMIVKNRSKKDILKNFHKYFQLYCKGNYSSFQALAKRSVRRFEERIHLLNPADFTFAVEGITHSMAKFS